MDLVRVLGSSSRGNCIIIDDGETKIMLDCGLPIKDIIKKTDYSMATIDSCFITHSHNDHCRSIFDVKRYGIDMFCSVETLEEILAKDKSIVTIYGVTAFDRDSRGKIERDSWSIVPFPLEHDVPNTGFLLSSKHGHKGVYITDTPYINYSFSGLTFAIIECNYDEKTISGRASTSSVRQRIIKDHMGLSQLIKFLQREDSSTLEVIYLAHMSLTNADEDYIKERLKDVTDASVYIAQQ